MGAPRKQLLPVAELAERVLAFSEGPTTHLKLQKLSFYSYGLLLSRNEENLVGDISFEAWKHGPVCRALYEIYKEFHANLLPKPEVSELNPYATTVDDCIKDVLAVYGKLTAWQLRDQSHLEEPWLRAWKRQELAIAHGALKTHFELKFAAGNVRPPELLNGSWSLALDGIPTPRFQSFRELADALR